jgi:hypothetical protein
MVKLKKEKDSKLLEKPVSPPSSFSDSDLRNEDQMNEETGGLEKQNSLLSNVIESLEKEDYSEAIIEENNNLTEKLAWRTLSRFAFSLNCGYNIAAALIFMLFLRGAASRNAPNSISVSINTKDSTITATKGELLDAFILTLRFNRNRLPKKIG